MAFLVYVFLAHLTLVLSNELFKLTLGIKDEEEK